MDFTTLVANEYHCSIPRERETFICECTVDREVPTSSCGEDCLNRMMKIECNSNSCPCSNNCSNQQFQLCKYAKVEVFQTEKKGKGLRILSDVPAGTFIYEYIGEVYDVDEFELRQQMYADWSHDHFYFMSFGSNLIIDATMKGSVSRYVNHSCEPNCETQKWTVNGQLRIGFFSIKRIKAGEEITFDYRFERYGEKLQECYCESVKCRGFLGEKIEKETSSSSTTKQLRRISSSGKRKRVQVDVGFLRLQEKFGVIVDEKGGISNEEGNKAVLIIIQEMMNADTVAQRHYILTILNKTESLNPQRAFLRFKGLEFLRNWLNDAKESQDWQLLAAICKLLEKLPISTKNVVVVSGILDAVTSVIETLKPTLASSQDDATNIKEEKVEDQEVSWDVDEKPNTIGQVKVEGDGVIDTDIKPQRARLSSKSSEEMTKDEVNLDIVTTCERIESSWMLLKEAFIIPKSESSSSVTIATAKHSRVVVDIPAHRRSEFTSALLFRVSSETNTRLAFVSSDAISAQLEIVGQNVESASVKIKAILDKAPIIELVKKNVPEQTPQRAQELLKQEERQRLLFEQERLAKEKAEKLAREQEEESLNPSQPISSQPRRCKEQADKQVQQQKKKVPQIVKIETLNPDWTEVIDKDSGDPYYYHKVTKEVQWEKPVIIVEQPAPENEMEISDNESASPDDATANGDKTGTKKPISEMVLVFKAEVSKVIVSALSRYRKDSCPVGRIKSTEDFKHVARKIAYIILSKERRGKLDEELKMTDSTRDKIKQFCHKYMEKCGPVYQRPAKTT